MKTYLRCIVDIDEPVLDILMVPWALRKEIVQSLHNHPTNGHRKYEKLAGLSKGILRNGTTIPKKSLAPLKPFRAGYPGMVLQLDCTETYRTWKFWYFGHIPCRQSLSKANGRSLLAYISVHSMPGLPTS